MGLLLTRLQDRRQDALARAPAHVRLPPHTFWFTTTDHPPEKATSTAPLSRREQQFASAATMQVKLKTIRLILGWDRRRARI
jgi:hypothetical protein